jgi:hypothetical protein
LVRSTFHVASNCVIFSSPSQDSSLPQQTKCGLLCYVARHCHLITAPVETVDFETDDECVILWNVINNSPSSDV